MCYSLTGTACFEPSPHWARMNIWWQGYPSPDGELSPEQWIKDRPNPAWSYSCPAEELDGTPLWHAYEMAHNYGHSIMLCPEHRESHPKVLKKWYIGEDSRRTSQVPEP